jgi:threonine/homoserine/homoserine lactone efflux protein
MAAVVMIVMNALGWHILLAYLFSRAQVRSGYSRMRGLANRMAAAVVGVLGLGLLVATLRDARSSHLFSL